MKIKDHLLQVSMLLLFASCTANHSGKKELKDVLIGSWQLIEASQTKNDTTVSTLKPQSKMIKIINASHFAFMQHDLQKAEGATSNGFVGGGGKYTLRGNQYTEHLEFCNFPGYEGHDFSFRLELRGDTLIQSGEEKLKDMGIGHENIKLREVYIRIR